MKEGNPAVGINFFAPDRKRSMSLQKPIPTLGFPGSFLFRQGGIFAEKKSVSTLADRRREKGVSSLQEPLCVSISARKPAFPHRRQGNEVQFRQRQKKDFPESPISALRFHPCKFLKIDNPAPDVKYWFRQIDNNNVLPYF